MRAAGVSTGSADCAITELKSDCWLKPLRSTVTVPDSMLRARVPLRFKLASATVLTPSG